MIWLISIVGVILVLVILRNYCRCPGCGKIVRIKRNTVKDDVISTVTHIYGKCTKCGRVVIDEYSESANIDPDAMP